MVSWVCLSLIHVSFRRVSTSAFRQLFDYFTRHLELVCFLASAATDSFRSEGPHFSNKNLAGYSLPGHCSVLIPSDNTSTRDSYTDIGNGCSMSPTNVSSLDPGRQTGPASYELTNFGGPSQQPSLATLNSQYSAESSKDPRHQPSYATLNSLRSTHKERVIGDKDDEDTDESRLEPDRSSQPSVNDASKIPNGGLWAWLQVLGAFFLLFNSWGVSNSHIQSLCKT